MAVSKKLLFQHTVLFNDLKLYDELQNIRIYHECEGRIEKYVTRIAVWHHEAFPVMTNSDPEGQIFLSYHHMNYDFFSCSQLFLFIYIFTLK